MINTGHGHVTSRDDGWKARCGGPPNCPECRREQAALGIAPPPRPEPPAAPEDSEGAWADWFDIQYALNRTMDDQLDSAGQGRSDSYSAALISSLIEHLAERQRRYIKLPGSDENPRPGTG